MFMSCTTGGRDSSAGFVGAVDLRQPAAAMKGKMIRQAMIQRFAGRQVKSVEFSIIFGRA